MQFLNVPGLYNSGPRHWQSSWETLHRHSFTRVEQKNWEKPLKEEWVSRLNDYIQQLTGPTILVAHSLGCITVAHWAASYESPLVRGAFLVAPADVESSSKDHFKTFAPVPLAPIAFPSTVIASTNDPYCAIDRAARWAAYWGSRFKCVGDKGHINSDSGLQHWNDGMEYLLELKHLAAAPEYKFAS